MSESKIIDGMLVRTAAEYKTKIKNKKQSTNKKKRKMTAQNN